MRKKIMQPAQVGVPFVLDEQGGDQFANLAEAQRAALRPLAADIAATLRALLAAGVLTIDGGRVIAQKQETA